MIRLAIFLLGIFILSIGVYVYFNPEETFEAKFKNIDGLPQGAPVTALGVKIGEVIRTKSVPDGILVTVRLTDKSAVKPPPGSLLSITSFRPNHGRVLEVISPSQDIGSDKAYIIQEPITSESWLHASIDLFDGLKKVSGQIVEHVTPENFEKARIIFSRVSESLNGTANTLLEHETNLIEMKQKLTKRTLEANELLVKAKQPIASLNKIISDKKNLSSVKADLNELSGNLTEISENLSNPETVQDLKSFKAKILDHLNDVNASLTSASVDISDSELSDNLMDFNDNLVKLNEFYDGLNKKNIKKQVMDSTRKAKEITSMLAKITAEK